MLSKRFQSPFMILFGIQALCACEGITNLKNAQSGQTTVQADSSTPSTQDCHASEYKQKINAYIENSCVTCHAGNSGGLLLAAGAGDSAINSNYTALLKRVDATLPTPDQTYLLKKITSGSGLNHPYQRNASDQIIQDFTTFVQNMITNPTCAQASPTPTPTCQGAGCFF